MNNILLHKYKNYVFDLDGTLIDSAPDIMACLTATFAAYSVQTRPLVPYDIGPPVEVMLHNIQPLLSTAQIAEMTLHFRSLYNASGTPQTALFPGVKKMLSDLQQRQCKIFLATNKVKVSTLRILDQVGIRNIFTEIMCCDSRFEELNRLQTKAEMIEYLLKKHTLASSETIMIGDSAHDIEGGKKAMVATAAVMYGYCPAQDIKALEPDYQVVAWV